MSRENLQIVRESIDAINRRDWNALLMPTAPGFVLDMSRAIGPGAGVYGLDELEAFVEDLTGNWEAMRIEPSEFIEAGDHVVVPYVVHSRGREGIEVTARPTFVWTIRGGLVERVAMYQEREDALEAVGLAEPD
jgi:ketosteroid isomerase-like protein